MTTAYLFDGEDMSPPQRKKTLQKLTLKIFDPTYYVDMSWKDSHDISFACELQGHCQRKLIEPNPTSAQISYAMSLPMDADPDNKLGQLFTQTLELSCKAQS